MTEKEPNRESQEPTESDSTSLALPGFGFPSVFEDFMRPFDEWTRSLFPSMGRSFWTELGEKEPDIDLQDRGDRFVLTAESPGFDRNDVEVRVDQNGLNLKATKRADKESKTSGGIQRQSSYSHFEKYYSLPGQILSEKAKGTMKNGVLELELPKRESTKDKSRKVDLK